MAGVPNTNLSDSEAKVILRRWPERTKRLWVPDGAGWWLRAQPSSQTARTPRFQSPGAELFHTQPDGLWLYLSPKRGFADAVAVEVCGTSQNLNDKRSRYMPATHSLMVECPLPWLKEVITVQHGASRRRWRAAGSITKRPLGDMILPVRFLRVLYALPNVIYERWVPGHVPSGYEYFCRHSSLDSYHAPRMQEFLRRMTRRSHYYTFPGS